MDNLEWKFSTYKRVWAEVDLDAIVENVTHIKENISANTKIVGVIKTDGYGHGAVPIAKVLEPLDFIYGFTTATAEEAHILRTAGIKKPILVLGYTFPYSYEMLAKEEIQATVFRRDSFSELSEAAKKTGCPVKVHVKVNTGMNRIGIFPNEEGISFLAELVQQKGIKLEGIFTHFAKADEIDKTSAKEQLLLFLDFVKTAEEKLGISIPVKHCSNSAGILELPEANMDIVRAGIALYGIYPSEEVNRENVILTPALSLYSHIVYKKPLYKGQSVSYGGTFTASKDMQVATIPIGYGDGYPRSLSGKGYVLIRGKKARILGRVCMDQMMVDVTEIPEALEGDKVTLIGRDEGEEISAEELGNLSGRFHYELLCDLGKRIPRVYKQGQKIVSVKDYYEDV